MRGGVRSAVGLARAAHPLPTLAVTALGTALGLLAGAGTATAVLLSAGLLTGQLSIGWLNDLLDADRDRRAGRTSKPVVDGSVRRSTLRVAVAAAGAGCVASSLALGTLPGVLNLLAVATGWSYDLGLKSTRASPLPYLLAFGLLPAVATTAAGAPVPLPLVAAAALLGVGAHFANTLPDDAADALTGVRGLPQRVGPVVSRAVAGAAVGAASTVLLVTGAGLLPELAVLLLVAGAGSGLLAALGPARWALRAVVLSAGLAVTGLLVAAG